jgi:ribosome biogenesis GTPase A
MNQKNIHWYPGHMKKAWNQVQERLALVDIVIEVVDARALHSTRYQAMALTPKQHRLVLVVKEDLADPIETKLAIQAMQHTQTKVHSVNLTKRSVGAKIIDQILATGAELHQKQITKGMKPQPLKVMIVGVPNVGKSTLINNLANKHKVATENRPGSTRGQQWIVIHPLILLLDTPGVLPPFYPNEEHGFHLALIHAIRLDILPIEMIADYLHHHLHQYYPKLLETYIGKPIVSLQQTWLDLAAKRGMLGLHGQYDIQRAHLAFVQDFQRGKIGRVTLEKYAPAS